MGDASLTQPRHFILGLRKLTFKQLIRNVRSPGIKDCSPESIEKGVPMIDFLLGLAFVAMLILPAAVAFVQHSRSNESSDL